MTGISPEHSDAIREGVDRSRRYDEIKTDATERAVEALSNTPVIWDRHGRGWYHALTAEAWAILLALHDSGLEIRPRVKNPIDAVDVTGFYKSLRGGWLDINRGRAAPSNTDY